MIICSAIKIKNPDAELGYTIIHGFRHCDCFRILHELRPTEKLHIGAETGFIDHRGNFLTREEAFLHAVEVGQLATDIISKKSSPILYSEDLW